MNRPPIANDRVREALKYNPKTGILGWKISPCPGVRHNSVAGCISYGGYQVLEFETKRYYAHRVAWFLHYGEWPARGLDHINGNKADNRIVNLRIATPAQNAWNSKTFKGGGWDKVTNSWRVRLKVNGVNVEVGRYKTSKEARKAYRVAALKHHGEFVTINFSVSKR